MKSLRAEACQFAVTCLVVGLVVTSATGQHIYWSDWNDRAIKRMNVDGTEVQTLVTLGGQPSGLAVDHNAGKLYWGMSTGPDRGSVLSADLDGSHPIVVAATGSSQVWNIAVDEEAIYFNSSGLVAERDGPGRLSRAGTEVDFYGEKALGEAMTFDRTTRQVYYQVFDPMASIRRRHVDGPSPPQTLLEKQSADYADYVGGIALDVANNRMYFTDSNGPGHRIMRAGLDGRNLELFADVEGFGRLVSLLVDPVNEVVYYGTFGGTIGVVNFDRTEARVISIQPGLYAFAFEYGVPVPEPSPLVLACIMLAGIICHARRQHGWLRCQMRRECLGQ